MELNEAFRACPTLFDAPSEWIPRVRTRPRELKVASGSTLHFNVSIGNEGNSPWTADLDDHCGLAMKPMILDATGTLVDDLAFLPALVCPSSRARITLSTRGVVTAQVSVTAIRWIKERVVTGNRTDKRGNLENVYETRDRSVPLPPGKYTIDLPLPTPNSDRFAVALEVTN